MHGNVDPVHISILRAEVKLKHAALENIIPSPVVMVKWDEKLFGNNSAELTL